MPYHHKRGGLNINGAGGRRHRPSGGTPFASSRLSSKSQSRAARASERAALSRAAKGRGTYIHPTGFGKRDPSQTRKMLLTVLFVAVIALALATTVGVLVYQQAARNALKPVFDTQDFSQQLTPVESKTDLFWNVLVHTDASSAEEGRGAIVDLALVCVDPDNVTLSFLWIPVNTRVYIDGVGYSKIEDAFADAHEEGIIAAVKKLANVDIAHYIEVNDAGLSRLESQLAPLPVDVATASKEALVGAICRRLFGSSSEQMSARVDSFTACVATDASSDEVTQAFRALHGINVDTSCYQETMPSTLEDIGGVQYSICSTDSWNTMVSRVSSGMSPVATPSEVDTNKVTRENCTVAVWNGVGVSGVANDCTNELKKLGWKVISTGNANQFVYDETFVVFKDTDDEAAARLLAADLGQGRVVRSYARYSYEGNLLVVIGKDYKPY